MSKGLKLFAGLELTKVSQLPEDKEPIETSVPIDDKPTMSTEALENGPGKPCPVPIKNISFTRDMEDENSTKWCIFATSETPPTQDEIVELLNIFNRAQEEDRITFYLPYWIDMYSAIAILTAAHRCKADITVVGAQQLTLCASLLLLCGKIRASKYDMIVFQPEFSFATGLTQDLKVSATQNEKETFCMYAYLCDAGLLSKEERINMLEHQAQVTLYGDELVSRVGYFNTEGLQRIKDKYTAYLD